MMAHIKLLKYSDWMAYSFLPFFLLNATGSFSMGWKEQLNRDPLFERGFFGQDRLPLRKIGEAEQGFVEFLAYLLYLFFPKTFIGMISLFACLRPTSNQYYLILLCILIYSYIFQVCNYLTVNSTVQYFMNLQQLSLNQLLLQQLSFSPENKNFYAFILSRSRNKEPNAQTFHLLYDLFIRDGDQWIEVIRRLIASTKYLQYFQQLIKVPAFYRPLIVEVYNFGRMDEINKLSEEIDAQIRKIGQKSLQETRVLMQTLALHYKMFNSEREHRSCGLMLANIMLKNEKQMRDVMIRCCLLEKIILNKKQEERKLNKECLALLKESTSLIVYLQQSSIKEFKFVSFIQFIKPLSTLFLHFYHYFTQNLSHLSLKATMDQQQYTFIFDFLASCSQISFLQPLHQQSICQSIIVNQIYDHHDFQEMKLINYEIYKSEFTDNFLSAYCFWIKSMAENIPGFLKSFLLQLNQYQKSLELPDLLIKLSIIHSALVDRTDLHEPILAISSKIFYCWEKLQPASKWQCLRYFVIYRDMMSKKQIESCFNIYMGILQKDQINEQLYSECKQILSDFIHNSKVKRVLSQNIGQVASQLLRLPPSLFSSYQIITLFFTQFDLLYERNGPEFIIYCSHAITFEIQIVWKHQRKCSQLILAALSCIQKAMQGEVQYTGVEQPLLSVLKLLEKPQRIEFEDELVKIMGDLIRVGEAITPELCLILTQVQKSYKKNNCKLSILFPILHPICTKFSLIRQILYEYEQLVAYFMTLFKDYLLHYSNDEYDLYTAETSSLLQLFHPFLQNYQSALTSNYSHLLQECCQIISKFEPSSSSFELLLQIQMTISHMIPEPFILSLIYPRLQNFQLFNYKYSIKMIPILMADWLHSNPEEHEQCIKNIEEYGNRVGDINRKSLKKNAYKEYCEFQKLEGKVYIEQLLRELKNKNKIDTMEYSIYLGMCSSLPRI